jgi:pyrroloquinoline quinone biosynthesis protein B
MVRWWLLAGALLVLGAEMATAKTTTETMTCPVELVVLGTAQDGGSPQLGHDDDPAWNDPSLRRTVTSLGLIDRRTNRRWLIDATPDLREQLYRLDEVAPVKRPAPGLDGVFLTHAHIGHYAGLMFFGKESMGTTNLPVYAMPRMAEFLRKNGPWSQLVGTSNISLRPLNSQTAVDLGGGLSITPIRVPHRQEFSEVVGFRIDGPEKKVLFIPDIDRWEDWDAQGVRIEDQVARVDVAYLDGTFFADGELKGRDMSKVPHPMIIHSMDRFAVLPESERTKIRFIHLNWSNPARYPNSTRRVLVEAAGFHVAEEMESVCL